MDLGNPAALQVTGSMTVSAWIYSAVFPVDDAGIVSKRGDATQRGYQLDTTVDTGPRTIGFKLGDSSGQSMIRYGATVLQLNQWYHVAGVYDAQAQTLNVYVNGALDNGTLVGTVTSTQNNTALDVMIGRRSGYSGSEFNGTIDEVRIYNRALSQAEIQADMNAAIAPPSPDTSAPTAPSELTASAPNASQINLAWTSSTDNFDVAGYRVERCLGAGCTNFVEVATALDVSFIDTGLTLGSTYSYRVRATDQAGNLSAYSNVASATTLSAPPNGGRVGAYPFDEGSGTTTADLSGQNNNGTLNGPTWTAAGEIGKALVFDGAAAYVDLGNPATLQLTGSMTVSAWINSAAFPAGDAGIVSKRGDPTQLGYQLDTTVDTGLRTIGFKLGNALGSKMMRYGASVLQLNQWYHVAGVYDAQAQTLNVYLNGTPDNGTLVGPVTATQHNTSLNVMIGRRSGYTGDEFNGTIDEVRIYNRALSPAEIQTDMNTSASAPPSGVTPPTVTSPAPGAVVSSDDATVSGTFVGSSNTGITVNGVVAAIVGNTFVAPNIQLQPGVNVVAVTLTTPNNQTVTQTFTVVSNGPAPIEVLASPTQGVAPLSVTFAINNRTGHTIQSVQADYTGAGSFANANPAALSNSYVASGIYQARFLITDSTGASYQQTVPIAVQDTAQIDQMLRAVWGGFTTVLAAGNTTQALQYFNVQAQVKYGPVLSALLPSLPQIVASFSAPQLMSCSGQVGEYVISRTINGVNQNFFIYFARDSDGVWRLDSM